MLKFIWLSQNHRLLHLLLLILCVGILKIGLIGKLSWQRLSAVILGSSLKKCGHQCDDAENSEKESDPDVPDNNGDAEVSEAEVIVLF